MKVIHTFKAPLIIDLNKFLESNDQEFRLVGRDSYKDYTILTIIKEGVNKIKISDILFSYTEEIDLNERNILVVSLFYPKPARGYEELFIEDYKIYKFDSFPEFEKYVLAEPTFKYTSGSTCAFCEEGDYDEYVCECELPEVLVNFKIHIPIVAKTLTDREIENVVKESNIAVLIDNSSNNWYILSPKGIYQIILKEIFKFADKERIVYEYTLAIVDKFKITQDLYLNIYYKYKYQDDLQVKVEIMAYKDTSINMDDYVTFNLEKNLIKDFIDPNVVKDISEFFKLLKEYKQKFGKILLDRNYLDIKEVRDVLPEEVIFLIVDNKDLFNWDDFTSKLYRAESLEIYLFERSKFKIGNVLKIDFVDDESKLIVRLMDKRVVGVYKIYVTDKNILSKLAKKLHEDYFIWRDLNLFV